MARRISRPGVRFIAGWEGFRSCPYPDPVGVWTIGYGHTAGVGPGSRCLTQEEARDLLRRDLNRIYVPAVRGLIDRRLRQRELDALSSFTYNLGAGSLESSTLRRRINSHEGATYRRRKRISREELPKWVKAGGQTLPGLVKRRAAEVAVAVHGNYSGRP
jgi:lysozyme